MLMVSEQTVFRIVVIAIFLMALVAAPATAARTITENGTNVFVGEENLVFDGDFAGTTRLVHYVGAIDESSIDMSIAAPAGMVGSLNGGIPTGCYYAIGSAYPDLTYVNIQNPGVTLDVVLDNSRKDSVDGKSITRNAELAFKVGSNVDTGDVNDMITIEVTLPGGGVVTNLGGQSLRYQADGSTRFIGPISLSTAEAGTYTAVAKWASTSDFFGKGYNSWPVLFEVTSRALAITSNKDTVIRGKSFAVTIRGDSVENYILSVDGVDSSNFQESPMIAPGQTAVDYTIPGENDYTRTVKTNAGGAATVQFNTTRDTGTKTYTVRVEDTQDPGRNDAVKVKVEAGSVTITTSGTGTYYIGEEITLAGTCTDNTVVYLFMTGPNLSSNGVNLTRLESVRTGNSGTFTTVCVDSDDTWSYKWNTADLNGKSLDAGSYTVYAISEPREKNELLDARYATASISLRDGFLTATTSGATVAKGDKLTIFGTAQGRPDNIYIWIFGKNYYGAHGGLSVRSVSVESDSSFEAKLESSDTESLAAGQYFVVVQHPMGANVAPIPGFNVAGSISWNSSGIRGPEIPPMTLTNLQAPAAVTALIDALDSPNIPDTYRQLTFSIEEPCIFIDPIGTRESGSKFAITGITNLAVGNTLVVDVTSAAFQPGTKTEPSNFSSVSGTTVVEGGVGMNTWSFEVDATGFKIDQYIVCVESIETSVTSTAIFTMVERGEAPPSPTEGLTLHPGWNFISIPRHLEAGNDTASIFTLVDTAGHSALRYDTAGRTWISLTPTDRLTPLEGIWIYSENLTTIPLTFSTDLPLPPSERSLAQGWNAIGITGTSSASARDTLLSVNRGWTTLIGFDAGEQDFEVAIINGGSGANTDGRPVYPGRGYWLYMTEPGDLCAIGV